jgi:uncharacterized YigZ family protein
VTPDADTRRVPAGEGRGEVREKASRFFGFAARCASPEEADRFLERLRREHHDATHVAFAWKIGAGARSASRASDAGEPSGTAGKPILGALESAGLTDAVAAVVRYYGGTNLGTGGLVRAYRLAAARALEAAGFEIVYETVTLDVRCPYDRTGLVRRLLDPPHVRLAAERFDPEPVIQLVVRRSRLEPVTRALQEARIEFAILES